MEINSTKKNKKRVIIVVPSLTIGGQERIAINTANSLMKDCDILFVIFHNSSQEYSVDFPVQNLDVPNSSNIIGRIVGQIRRSRKLSRLRKQFSADVVYSFGTTANITNVLSRGNKKGKTVVSFHGFASVKKSILNQIVIKKADRIVVVSKEMRDEIQRLFPTVKKLVVIENGYQLPVALNSARNKEGFINLVTMGRLSQVKGYDRLIKAFAIIASKEKCVKLSFIGEGPEKGGLETLSKNLGISDRVAFLGYKERPNEELCKHSIFLNTSFNEGFPNALIEALNCGLAVIAVDCQSGPREILSEEYQPQRIKDILFEKYGVLVEDRRDDSFPSLFATAVLKLIHDEQLLVRYQEVGPSRAKQYSLEVYKEKVLDLFESLE